MAKGTVGASQLRHIHLQQAGTPPKCPARHAAPWPGCTGGCARAVAACGQRTHPRVRALAYTHSAVLPAPSAVQPPEAPAQGTLACS